MSRRLATLTTMPALLLAGWVGSCAGGKANIVGAGSTKAGAASPTAETPLTPGSDGGAGGNGADGGADVFTDSGDGGPKSQSIEDVIKQCGVKAADLKNPDFILFDKEIKSFPKVFVGAQAVPLVGDVNFRVTVVTRIAIKATPGQTVQTVDFDLTATPSQAMAKATAAVAKNRGTATLTNFTIEERTALIGDQADWAGIICSIQPAKELRTAKGGTVKSVKFTPALPSSVSPKADPARYATEIGPVGSEKVFDNIEAEVMSSTDPALPSGKKVKGKAIVRRINPTLVINAGAAGVSTFTADMAFKISYEFESLETVVALGLMPSQSYYISNKDRDLKVVVAETGTPDGGTVVLSDK